MPLLADRTHLPVLHAERRMAVTGQFWLTDVHDPMVDRRGRNRRLRRSRRTHWHGAARVVDRRLPVAVLVADRVQVDRTSFGTFAHATFATRALVRAAIEKYLAHFVRLVVVDASAGTGRRVVLCNSSAN